MSQILDVSVWNTANKYQDAAELLNINNMKWVACINSALAIEIYLKSTLSETFLTKIDQIDGLTINQVTSKTHRGHDLTSLYKKISNPTKKMLNEAFNNVAPNIELESELAKYNDVFANARYMFELESKSHIDTGIIQLAGALRQALNNLGLKHNSP